MMMIAGYDRGMLLIMSCGTAAANSIVGTVMVC
jgi:hypothetical protein